MNSKIIANGILRAIGIIVLILLTGYALYLLQSILLYIVLALIISLIGRPMTNFFNTKLKFKNKTVCVILTMSIFIILTLGIFSLFIPLLVSQSKNLSLLNINQLKYNIDQISSQISNKFGFEEQFKNLDISQIFRFEDIPNIINSIVGFIGNFGIGFLSVLFITFFFMKDGDRMLQSGLSLFSRPLANRITSSIEKINDLLSRYFVGLIMQISILFVIYTIILLIFGVENAFIIAFLCSLLNLIPYLGPVIGFVLMALLTMSSNINSDFNTVTLPTTIYVLIGFLIGQLIDNFFSQPFIFSNSVKSNPLEIFLVILVSGTLLGVIGMVIAVPAYTVIKVILKEIFPGNRLVRFMTKNI
ncbi:MAG: AI-2E family transporter [Capnocytophaga sp.]|nr:AI-2E family transporter [Capnocytophaga sp.]